MCAWSPSSVASWDGEEQWLEVLGNRGMPATNSGQCWAPAVPKLVRERRRVQANNMEDEKGYREVPNIVFVLDRDELFPARSELDLGGG
jgi:hypothetical protein